MRVPLLQHFFECLLAILSLLTHCEYPTTMMLHICGVLPTQHAARGVRRTRRVESSSTAKFRSPLPVLASAFDPQSPGAGSAEIHMWGTTKVHTWGTPEQKTERFQLSGIKGTSPGAQYQWRIRHYLAQKCTACGAGKEKHQLQSVDFSLAPHLSIS